MGRLVLLTGLLGRWLIIFALVFPRVLSPFQPATDTSGSPSQPHPEGEACTCTISAFTTGNPFWGQNYLKLVQGGVWGL